MPNDDHPQIPDDPRFRTIHKRDVDIMVDEFLVRILTPTQFDNLLRRGADQTREEWVPISQLVGLEIQNCANAGRAAWLDVAEAHGLQGGKTPQAWYAIHDDALNRADAWAEWAKQAP